MDRFDRLERFTEFLLIGVALGVIEDLIAVYFITGEKLTLEMIGIVIAVTVPFAAFSELVVDNDSYRITETLVEKIRGGN